MSDFRIDPNRPVGPSVTRPAVDVPREVPVQAPAAATSPSAPGPRDLSQVPGPAGNPARLTLAGASHAVTAGLAAAGGVKAARLADPVQRRGIGDPMYQATLIPGTPPRRFFSENDVPMGAMVINSHAFNRDGLHPRFIAQAAVKANPDIQLVVPTEQPFDGPSDPRFAAERAHLARELGVDEKNIFPARSDMASFPQDEFLAGVVDGQLTLVTPNDRNSRPDRWGKRDESGNGRADKVTRDGAAMLAQELGIRQGVSDSISEGGDTQFVTRPDGRQGTYFSAYTVNRVAATRDIDPSTPTGFMKALDVTMRGMRAAGVAVEDMAPLGQGDVTYRQALDRMSPEDRASLDPEIRQRFEQLGDLPLPMKSFVYHSDLTMLTPDGKTAFIDGDRAKAQPQLETQLRAFGYDPVRMPAVNHDPRPSASPDRQIQGISASGGGMRLSYMNTIQGTVDGRKVFLMPTEAHDPSRLTPRDLEARDLLLRHSPGALVVPVGAHSGVTGFQARGQDGAEIYRDNGIHCATNVLPARLSMREL